MNQKHTEAVRVISENLPEWEKKARTTLDALVSSCKVMGQECTYVLEKEEGTSVSHLDFVHKGCGREVVLSTQYIDTPSLYYVIVTTASMLCDDTTRPYAAIVMAKVADKDNPIGMYLHLLMNVYQMLLNS